MCGFEDPTLTAQDATVFWDGRISPAVVSVRCTSAQDALGRTELWSWTPFKCTIRTYRDETGTTHVLFRRDGRSVQLLMHGDAADDQTFYAIFEAETLARAEIVKRVLMRLQSFQSPMERRKTRSSTQFEDHLHHYLIALDGALAGASYRQIARTIYGKARVADAWTAETTYLKNRTRRAVERGLALMNGGYLTLLQ